MELDIYDYKQRRLEDEFEWVKVRFYPNLDAEWKIFFDEGHGFTGECVRDNKEILIGSLNFPLGELRALIIHEIAHALTTGQHDETFYDCLRDALKIARRLKEREVAKFIKMDLDDEGEFDREEVHYPCCDYCQLIVDEYIYLGSNHYITGDLCSFCAEYALKLERLEDKEEEDE